MALFFLKATAPHKLKDAPGGEAYLSKERHAPARGKIVFAERCARCHSSKLPATGGRARPGWLLGQGLPDLLEQILGMDQDRRLQAKMRAIVHAPDFLDDNFLSTEDARSGDACCRPTPAARWQPMRSRTISGITSPRKLTRSFPR